MRRATGGAATTSTTRSDYFHRRRRFAWFRSRNLKAHARRDSLVEVRDEFDACSQRFDRSIPSNTHHPHGEMAPSISAGFLRVKRAGNECIEAPCGSGCLFGERYDFIFRAFSWQRLVVKQCITGAGCHERLGIGAHRTNGVPIIIQSGMPPSAILTRVADAPDARLRFERLKKKANRNWARRKIRSPFAISRGGGSPRPN